MEACHICDVRHPTALAIALAQARPEVVFHLAAQPLVRASFAQPAETFEVNALGTAHLLDAVRVCEGVRAVVVVTSDKCYAPHAGGRPHVEEDPLGGEDPYSASKACAELIVTAYRESFFSDPDAARVASARAGNVIGGGDFGADRLLPDVFRAALAGTLEGTPHGGGQAGTPLLVRNPEAVRPWQHVLSPLSGYLVLAQALCECQDVARAWNFGPAADDALPVRALLERVCELWPEPVDWRMDEREHPRENPVLRLDSGRARTELGWEPLVGLEDGLRLTVDWFRAHAAGEEMRAVTLGQIEAVEPTARRLKR
jgi:CDP-glucose 4,6-dehydratase